MSAYCRTVKSAPQKMFVAATWNPSAAKRDFAVTTACTAPTVALDCVTPVLFSMAVSFRSIRAANLMATPGNGTNRSRNCLNHACKSSNSSLGKTRQLTEGIKKAPLQKTAQKHNKKRTEPFTFRASFSRSAVNQKSAVNYAIGKSVYTCSFVELANGRKHVEFPT